MNSHYKEKGLSINTIIIISIIFLMIFGLYKNGLAYYFLNQISLKESLQPLLIFIISFIIGIIMDILTKNKTHQYLIYTLLIAISMPYQINIILYSLIMSISLYLFDKFKMTIHPVIIIHLLLVYTLSHGYENIYEQNNIIFYGILDTLFGKTIGGIGNTSIIIMLITYLILCTRFYYKKEIPIITIITYLLFTLIYDLFTNNPNLIIHLLNYKIYFIAIYLISENKYTPLEKNKEIIYAVTIGLAMFILSIYEEGPYLAALIPFIYKIFRKTLSKKQK